MQRIFQKKKVLLFSETMVCFLSKGFSQSGQVFSFLKGCGFVLFFKCFCFCCFCKTQGLFFFKMVEIYKKKKKFSSMFWKRKKLFFKKNKKVVVFSPKCFIFSRFLLF